MRRRLLGACYELYLRFTDVRINYTQQWPHFNFTALRLLPRETGIWRASLLPDAILFCGLHKRISASSVSRHTTEDTPALMFADRGQGRRTRQRRRFVAPAGTAESWSEEA